MGPPWRAFCQITLTSCFSTESKKRVSARLTWVCWRLAAENNACSRQSIGIRLTARHQSPSLKQTSLLQLLLLMLTMLMQLAVALDSDLTLLRLRRVVVMSKFNASESWGSDLKFRDVICCDSTVFASEVSTVSVTREDTLHHRGVFRSRKDQVRCLDKSGGTLAGKECQLFTTNAIGYYTMATANGYDQLRHRSTSELNWSHLDLEFTAYRTHGDSINQSINQTLFAQICNKMTIVVQVHSYRTQNIRVLMTQTHLATYTNPISSSRCIVQVQGWHENINDIYQWYIS